VFTSRRLLILAIAVAPLLVLFPPERPAVLAARGGLDLGGGMGGNRTAARLALDSAFETMTDERCATSRDSNSERDDQRWLRSSPCSIALRKGTRPTRITIEASARKNAYRFSWR